MREFFFDGNSNWVGIEISTILIKNANIFYIYIAHGLKPWAM